LMKTKYALYSSPFYWPIF